MKLRQTIALLNLSELEIKKLKLFYYCQRVDSKRSGVIKNYSKRQRKAIK